MRVAGEQESETDADLVKVNPIENRQRKVLGICARKKSHLFPTAEQCTYDFVSMSRELKRAGWTEC
jgi:hypothetical protein